MNIALTRYQIDSIKVAINELVNMPPIDFLAVVLPHIVMKGR